MTSIVTDIARAKKSAIVRAMINQSFQLCFGNQQWHALLCDACRITKQLQAGHHNPHDVQKLLFRRNKRMQAIELAHRVRLISTRRYVQQDASYFVLAIF
jgi:hypothetical protein